MISDMIPRLFRSACQSVLGKDIEPQISCEGRAIAIMFFYCIYAECSTSTSQCIIELRNSDTSNEPSDWMLVS